VLIGLVLALLFLDLFVLHRGAREMPFKEAIWLSVFWVAVSLAFGGSSVRPGGYLLARGDSPKFGRAPSGAMIYSGLSQRNARRSSAVPSRS
jgi:hypothetical protein